MTYYLQSRTKYADWFDVAHGGQLRMEVLMKRKQKEFPKALFRIVDEQSRNNRKVV